MCELLTDTVQSLKMYSHVRVYFGSLFQDFFITKYNTIVLIFSYVFIGFINYKKNFFTIFNTILYWFFKPK